MSTIFPAARKRHARLMMMMTTSNEISQSFVSEGQFGVNELLLFILSFHLLATAPTRAHLQHHLPKGWFWLYDSCVSLNRCSNRLEWIIQKKSPSHRKITHSTYSLTHTHREQYKFVIQMKWVSDLNQFVSTQIAWVWVCERNIPRKTHET